MVANTVVWVATVVAVTIVVSLGLAQLLNAAFPGPPARAVGADRAVGRLADHDREALRVDLRLLLRHPQPARSSPLRLLAAPVDWLGDDATVMGAMIAVGVFVSLPFTTYVLLAGLPAIPDEVYEAARVDGASRLADVPVGHAAPAAPGPAGGRRAERDLRLQLVSRSCGRSTTATPGFGHDTMITYMYKIAFKSALRDVGLAAALGVVNVLMILVAVLVYLRDGRGGGRTRPERAHGRRCRGPAASSRWRCCRPTR